MNRFTHARKPRPALGERVDGADGVVVVMGMISHSAVHKVQRISRQRGMPMMRAGGPASATCDAPSMHWSRASPAHPSESPGPTRSRRT